MDFPFFQINKHTCVYHHSEQMGSRQLFLKDDAQAQSENNIAAIRDLFRLGGEQLQMYLPKGTEERLVCEKYLQHANGALSLGKKSLAWEYFKKSIQHNHHFWFPLESFKHLLKYLIPYHKFLTFFGDSALYSAVMELF